MSKIYVWQNPRTKQWRGAIVSHNGNMIWETSESYNRKHSALRAVTIAYDYFYMMSWQAVMESIIYSQPKPSPRRKRKAR